VSVLSWLFTNTPIGKSVLCSCIISSLNAAQKTTNLYYFCNSFLGNRDLCGTIFRTLVLQLVRNNIELASHISDNYVSRGLTCSMTRLKELLPNLIMATSATRIIIDGLDECEDRDQKQILQELMKLGGNHCKILISSRDYGHIGKILRKKKTIAFRDRRNDINKDIQLYVTQALAGLRQQFEDQIIDEIKRAVVEKADGTFFVLSWHIWCTYLTSGMFLWVRLVVDSILDCHSIGELREAVIQLPEGLDAA
jgi:hypothetical protein